MVKRGRPPKDPRQKKVTAINIRTTAELRTLVEESAQRRGWSIAAEAAHRLLQSFRDDQIMRAIGVLQRRMEELIDIHEKPAVAQPATEQPELASGASLVKVRILPDGRMTREDAARYLGHSPKTLAMWHVQGKGPRCVKFGRRAFYFKPDVDDWIAGRQ